MNSVENLKHCSFALVSSLLLFLSAIMIPVAGMLLIPLIPHPLLFLGAKRGKEALLGTGAAVTVVVLLLGGAGLALGYLVVASMAVFLFFSLRRGRSLEKIVLLATTGFFALGLITVYALIGSLAELQNHVRETLGQNLALALKFYESIGVSGESTEALREHTPQLIELILRILPAIVFAGCAGAVLLNVMLLFRRLPEARGHLLPDGDPKEWKSPDILVWCFILSGFCLLVVQDSWVRVLLLNLFLISVVFYFFQGLAIVAYYFHYKNVPVFLRGIGYALIFLEQLFTLLVVGLGLFDLWGDFRRLNKRDLHPTQTS